MENTLSLLLISNSEIEAELLKNHIDFFKPKNLVGGQEVINIITILSSPTIIGVIAKIIIERIKANSLKEIKINGDSIEIKGYDIEKVEKILMKYIKK